MIISGTGAYTDPWHPFAETSARLAELISSAGHQVAVAGDVEESLLRSASVELLVINIGNPQPPRPASVMIEIQQSLLAHLERGGGLLGMHVSATSFTTMPRWAEILGGHWVRGTTMHPPLGPAVINVRTGAHPITDGLAAIEVVDERYCFLDVNDDVTVLGDHEQDGVVHPMIWTRQQGAGRVVYDGLGHDARSYQSEGHRQLLQRAADWLLAG
jgi:type 1 glutamine amidotransferase